MIYDAIILLPVGLGLLYSFGIASSLQPTWVNWDVTSVCLKALEHFLQFAHPYFRHRTPSLKTVSNAVTRKHRTLGCAVCSENDTTPKKKHQSNIQNVPTYHATRKPVRHGTH